MTNFFTAFRFSLKENCEIPEQLDFESEGFTIFKSNHWLQKCQRSDAWNVPDNNSANNDVKVGRRSFGKITIETYMAEQIKEISKDTWKANQSKLLEESRTSKNKKKEEVAAENNLTETAQEAEKNEKPVSQENHVNSKKKEGEAAKPSSAAARKEELKSGSEGTSAASSQSPKARKKGKNTFLKGHSASVEEESPLYSDVVNNRSRRDGPKQSLLDALKQSRSKTHSLDRYRISSGEASSAPPHKDTVPFTCGNPAVEVTEGIIHLFKSDEPFPWETESVHASASVTSKSRMLCILAVPTTLNCRDLIQFFAPAEGNIEHIKVIKDSNPNHYMVLLKFSSESAAGEFYRDYNGRQYNTLEEDVCHLVVVARIETVKCSDDGDQPIPGMTELPICPVCLERMDESVSGVLTILCNHSFHTSCLTHWEDSTCPVCRYIQTPEQVAEHLCFQCSSPDNLWICLICGHIGCGRYAGGHAFEHFKTTSHTFAMQLGSRCVWDYAADNFVHRLVQNKSDGKMVQVEESAGQEGGGGGAAEEQEGEKMDSVTLEFTYLLTSQLEAQRVYFEQRIQHVELEALRQMEEHEEKARQALERSEQLEHQVAALSRERQAQDKKHAQASTRLNKLQSEVKEERAINKSLRSNQEEWLDKVKKMEKDMEIKNKEVADLKDQLRDVMFFMEAQQQLTQSQAISKEELAESQVVVNTASKPSPTGSKGHRKKGK